VTASGVVVDTSAGFNSTSPYDETKYPALAGVEVCLYGNTAAPCATTDASGKYSIVGVPSGTVTFSYKKAGYQSVLYPTAYPGSLGALFMLTTSAYSTWLAKAGASIDPTKGEILFGAGTTVAAPGATLSEMFGPTTYYYASGYTVALSPAAALGPVYFSPAVEPDPALTSASAAGTGLLQVLPGAYSLTFTDPMLTCPPAMATGVAGYTVTYVGSICSLPDGGAPAMDAGGGG